VKLPYLPVYVGDYLANAKTRMLTWPEHGILLHFLFMAHTSEEYGVVRYSLKDIAKALGCREKDLRALHVKRVIKGADAGERCPALIFVPRHAGKDGPAVTLLPEQDGPVWYSSRMVRDAYVRHVKATKGGLKETPEAPPNGGIGEPIGGHSVSVSSQEKHSADAGADAPATGGEFLFGPALQSLLGQGMKESSARSLIGKARSVHGDDIAAGEIRKFIADGTTDLQSRIAALGKRKPRRAADADLSLVDYDAGLPVQESR
jgi:hypothetical protein